MTVLSDMQTRARTGLSRTVRVQPSIAKLVDNSGGAAVDGTIAAVTDAATSANAIKELNTKLNTVIDTLDTAGVTL